MKNISKGYEDISVQIIDYNMALAEHAWNCYRMTWKHLQNVQYDVNNKDVIEAIKNITFFRALPMPREQAIITFRLNNISRVCLAQITRQRKACFNVESQMPRPIEHNVIMPLNIYNDDSLKTKADEVIRLSQDLYNECIAKGIPPQDARYLTMHGQTTSCVYVVDINTFVSSFGFRCENNLSDEINLVYRLCKHEFIRQLQSDYTKANIDYLTYSMYLDILKTADAAGANRKVGQNYDKVFGNSFKRYQDANEEITTITKNCDYDFTKSAWYLELQRLPSELLFDNEKEMITSWQKK